MKVFLKWYRQPSESLPCFVNYLAIIFTKYKAENACEADGTAIKRWCTFQAARHALGEERGCCWGQQKVSRRLDFASALALLTLSCVTLTALKKPLAIDFCSFLFRQVRRLTIQLVLKQKKDANDGTRQTLLGTAFHLPTLPLVHVKFSLLYF